MNTWPWPRKIYGATTLEQVFKAHSEWHKPEIASSVLLLSADCRLLLHLPAFASCICCTLVLHLYLGKDTKEVGVLVTHS